MKWVDESKLTDDEKRIVSKLTDKLIEFGAKEKISRTELFSRLSTLVEGIKLGLQCRRYWLGVVGKLEQVFIKIE